ncbi:hypothetical protein SELMODRAFT_445437 [Selaginella moellendorffii]|uniref:DIS3-like exonuclease 2 n=1 Tax=Selaginella moellendorffii TaxID=88036 RepID=D8SIN8_SELML|nr:DIS3-like exonuclease 2 isoform X2 [Selaginella moellendorffii]EFJ15652.1 hypothetical protein SELMODRAFT_445437 [Selaginella moellendorffii]|eukprot:XP_002983310.1 DIS3-like exonuclease 2 isoform X2 [Selaginella moellendorffii]
MKPGGKNEKGGYHAVPPPPSLYGQYPFQCQQQSPVSKPRTRSAGGTEDLAARERDRDRDGEKKFRKRPSRKSKQFVSPDNGSGVEIFKSCDERASPTSSPVSPNFSVQRSRDYHVVKTLYKNGKYSELEFKEFTETLPPYGPALNNNHDQPSSSNSVAFVSPGKGASPLSTRFYGDTDTNFQLMKDPVAPQIFPEHWSLPKVNEAMQSGRVFSCSLRVNAHNRSEAYATVDGLSVDILIEGACAQNRALEGDLVALVLDPPNLWPRMKGLNNNRTDRVVTASSIAVTNQSFSSGEGVQVSREIRLEEEVVIESVGRSNQVVESSEDSSSLLTGTGSTALEKVQALLQATPGKRPTGKVVSILSKSRRRDAVVGFLSVKFQPPTRNQMVLTPVDAKFPKMVVLPDSLPEVIAQRLRDGDRKMGNELLAACVDRWDCNSPYPLAIITHCLGQAGELEAQTAAILFEHAVHSAEFPPEAMACLPRVPWSIPEKELQRRRDLRSRRVFTIDPVTARDLDDALSVEHLGDGLTRVGVHIADVSYFVHAGSGLDKEAQQRSTSVYLIQQVLPMLPRLLCEELCSLQPGVDRLAFSVMWDLDSTGQIVKQWIGRTAIKSCCKLSYGDAQEIVDGTFSEKPGLSGNFSWQEVAADIKTLYNIAKQLEESRIRDGALRLDTGKLVFALDGDGNPHETSFYEQMESNKLVQEFMLLANVSVAKVISRAFPDCALLRRHPEPSSRKLLEFQEFCKKHGFVLKTDSSADLHASLEVLREELKDDPVLLSIVTLYATKPMQVAKYFCTGRDKDGDWGHYALAMPVYTHFTSPIRRYPDIVVHRTLSAALEAEKLLNKSLTGPEDLVSTKDYEVLQLAASKHRISDPAEMALVADHCNERKMASKNVQEATDRLYLWTMLQRRKGLLSDACVVGLGPKFMSLYVSKIAMERRLYYDEVEGLKVDWLENTGTLVLDYCRPRQHSRKAKSRSISDVAVVSNPAMDPDDETGNLDSLTMIEPEAMPLTLRLFSHIPVLIHALGGDSSPLDIGVRVYVTSYLFS